MSDEDAVVTIEVGSIVATAADCADIVLRETNTTRMLFRAKIVEGQTAGAGVRGSLIFQRKARSQDWEECTHVKLNSLKAGEAVSIEMRSAEVLELRQWLTDLQLIKDHYGVPPQDTKFIGIRNNPIASWSGESEVEVLVPKAADNDHLIEALKALLAREDLDSVAAALKATSVDQLLTLRRTIGVSALDSLLAEWGADPQKDDEEHWQQLLTRYAFALEQVFHASSILHQGKAYVGGKAIDNSSGNIADFLLKGVGTGRAMLVEIKKPTTLLINPGKPYRNNVWNAHKELSGSILQALTYRDTLHEELRQLDQGGTLLHRALPACAVIVGHTSSLANDDQRRSFELARQRPDVVVLTFDELHARLLKIRDALLLDEPVE